MKTPTFIVSVNLWHHRNKIRKKSKITKECRQFRSKRGGTKKEKKAKCKRVKEIRKQYLKEIP